MEDSSLSFLLDNLKQLLIHHVGLITGVKTELKDLEKELLMFQAFLIKVTTKRRRNDPTLRELIRDIQEIVYEAEDIIDSFVTMATVDKRDITDYFKKPLDLHSIAKDVKDITSKVKKLYGGKSRAEFALINIDDPDPAEENEAPVLRQENIVGFEDELAEFVRYLKEDKDQLDVLSIIGMPGLGKSTLAGMIYRHPDIIYQFPTRIWVYVSQEFNTKNVLLAILRETNSFNDDMVNKTDMQLGELVAECLKNGKFLIVMDDVWTAENWKMLRDNLPMSNGNGKLLITSRQMEVGNAASRNSSRPPHELRFLTPSESWLLLRLEVFNNDEPRTELEDYGESILKKCNGLPLSIVVIGGILSERVSATDVSGMLTMWKEVSENVNSHIVTENATKRVEKIIALSYDKLPHHLRACFLYLGMFPEDFEIPTWKLTRMWIGEGFIQQKNTGSLEESAENHLRDLINRNLLRVHKVRRNGKAKTCRVHDMIRDFCITEAGNERECFLQEINKSSVRAFDPHVDGVLNFRRICIHDNVVNFLSSKRYGPKVRSFVCFSEEDIILPKDKNSAITASFKLLRVLEVQPIKFNNVPRGIEHLLHLRFVSISLNIGNLPPVFSKLWNIQTLIVNTKSRTLDIKADVWNMKRLRHFQTNASATLPKIGKNGSPETSGITTLGLISPQSCTKSVFDKVSNVKKIGIRGELGLLLESKNGISFNNMAELQLEKLKLVNDVQSHSTTNNPLKGLPPVKQFPPSLRRLTLSNTYLEWSKMSVLGQLENLEVLKLKENAFVGDTWVAVDNGFRKLEVLYIFRTNLVDWIASCHHFPKLRVLELLFCESLSQIPMMPSLQTLNIHRCAEAFVEKFRGIKPTFKLTIFPPLE